jgi:CMP-N-acetylneuraminic acid synthetase
MLAKVMLDTGADSVIALKNFYGTVYNADLSAPMRPPLMDAGQFYFNKAAGFVDQKEFVYGTTGTVFMNEAIDINTEQDWAEAQEALLKL